MVGSETARPKERGRDRTEEGMREKERDRKTVRENRAPIKRTESDGECALIATRLCMCSGGTRKGEYIHV